MQRRYRNLVYEALEGSLLAQKMDKDVNINLDQFEFDPIEKTNSFILVSLNTDAFFRVVEKLGQYRVQYKPAINRPIYDKMTSDFNKAIEHIFDWVDSIVEEYIQPDLWEEYAKSQPKSVLDTVTNEPLTQDEQIKAVQILENVKTYILENSSQEDTESLKAHIDSRFAILHDALDKSGKQAWILTVMGAVFGLIGSHVFSAENVSDFIQFAMEQLQVLSDLDVPTLVNDINPPEIQGDTVGKPH